MRQDPCVDVQVFKHLFVALEDLDGIPALLFLGQVVYDRLLDMRQRVLDRTREAVLRDGLSVLCRLDRGVCRLTYTGFLQRRDLDDRAADLTGQLGNIDLVAFLFHDIHHIDGDDHRDTELRQLRGQIQVALQVRAVDDVEDRVGALSDQIVSRHDFLERIGGKGIDAGQVGDRHTVVLFQFAFLFFYRDARPVSDELIGAGQSVEQRCFPAVGVARKGDSDVHKMLPFCSIEF